VPKAAIEVITGTAPTVRLAENGALVPPALLAVSVIGKRPESVVVPLMMPVVALMVIPCGRPEAT
jgi:hypothetical protein